MTILPVVETPFRTTPGNGGSPPGLSRVIRGTAVGWARAGVVLGASLAAGWSSVLRPSLLAPAAGAGVLVGFVFLNTTALVAILLGIRDVSDSLAGSIVAGGLNPGALLGLVIIVVAVFRLVGVRARGFAPALGLSALAICWFFVGFIHFGADASLVRELVRVISIAALTLVVLNATDVRSPTSIAGAVVLAGIAPAIVALVQWAQGRGFAGTDRIYGTLGHPNAAAALFSVCLSISLWKLAEEGRSVRYLLASLLFLVALVGTAAIGGMARMLVTLFVYGLLAGRVGARGRRFVVIALLIAAGFSLSPLGRDRLAELQTTTSFSQAAQGDYTNSLDWRFLQWSELIDIWRGQPYLGYGLGTTESLITPGGLLPHSDPIRFLVETGGIGFILFGGMYMLLLRRLWWYWRFGQGDRRYAALVLAIVFGLTVHALADNIFEQTAAVYAAAVLVASVFVANDRRAVQPRPR